MSVSDGVLDNGDVVVFEPPPRRRPFSPGDLVRLVMGAILLVIGALLAELAQGTIAGIERDLISVFSRLPDGLEQAVLGLTQITVGLVPFVVVVVLLVKRRWGVAVLLLLASVLANLGMALADSFVLDRGLADVLEELGAQDGALTDAAYPGANVIASTTAMVTVAAPWLSRRWKRALWGAVGLLVLLRMIAVSQPALDLVMALGVGTIVGSAILVLFGSPNTEPQPNELVRALRSSGVDPAVVDRADARSDALRYEVTDADGSSLVMTLRTPDDRDADLLNRWYRQLRYRASEVRSTYSTVKQRIEHEALMLGLAGGAGVQAPEVLQIGTTERGSAFYLSPQLPTRPATPDDLSRPAVLDRLWRQVARLHDAGVAHRHLALESVHVDGDGRVWLLDFDGAETASNERERARDVAQLLTETALSVGSRPAATTAVAVMGPQHVASALRMLQPLALPPTTRARAEASPGLLDELRAVVNETTGEPGLELDELQRVKPRTVLIVVASSLAFYSLLPQLANVDETVDALADAQPLWFVAALLASAASYGFAAMSFTGAVPEPVPPGPNLRAQLASSFASLVGPAGAGGFALTARFLERLGVGRAEAGASVAVNAIAGFVVHLGLMVGFFVWAGRTSIGGFSLPDAETVLLAVAVVMALAGVLLVVGPVRRKVLTPAWAQLRRGLAAIAGVFSSPLRVAQLFGGSAGISLAYLVALACTVEALGGGIGFAQLGAAYLGAVLLASLAPTPGGLGALESAMIAGLTGFGLDSAVAVSATLIFRMATFWLPILPGWAAFGWMQHNDEL